MKKKIALLSNVTMDMLAKKLKKNFEVYIPAGFDNWGQEIFNECSPIFQCDAIFVLLDGVEARQWKNREDAFSRLELWENLVLNLCNRESSTPIFISTVDVKENRIKTVSERIYHYEWEQKWYETIQTLSENQSNVYVFDVVQMILDAGRNNFYSEKMWYMGSMPYSKIGLQMLQEEITLLMESAFGQRKKVIVLDMDNTLWGGVIGEDGVDGIMLSEHKDGEWYYNLQRQLLEMKRRGVLLAVASKNNETDVKEVWDKAAMLLKKEDFVSLKINWQPKAMNLIEMQKELNLTEGSFVFFDDNPVEREAMRQQCPGVLVADFPEEELMLDRTAEKIYKEAFRQLRLTSEDTEKTNMYLVEAKRKKEQSESLNLDDYLKKLEICIEIHRMRPNELERVTQLCNKTNQFNLTTKRYSSSEIDKMAGDIFVVYAEDKYGTQGLVSVIILKRELEEIQIDTFLMSCRVMGRKLENVIMQEVVNYYRPTAKKIIGTYIPTEKNKPVEFLYESLGFQLIEDKGEKTYELKLDGFKNQEALPCKSIISDMQ